ncbi:MAG: hypothetical protein RQ741_06920 [Wenzhouxiangellaceae bacterium]|nr:hypothetical protein [Wenzhouxiangellaceae bacterium]
MLNRSLRCIVALASTALAACAAVPQAAPSATDSSASPVRASLQVNHSLPMISDSSDEMFSGRVDLGTRQGLIDYGVRYRIRQGSLFQIIREGKGDLDAAQNEVVLQTMEQTLGSTLPLPLGTPLKLALTSREQSRMGMDGQRQSQSTDAELQWSAGVVDLQVQWSRAQARSTATGGVDCEWRADLQMPAGFIPGATGSVFELSGQRCRGRMPEHGLSDLGLTRWMAAWRWGAEHDSALRLVRSVPAAAAETGNVLTPDYELGLSHEHQLAGGWQARADVSVLRAEPVEHAFVASSRASVSDWSAKLALERQLDLLAVTAGWAHAAERLWFATAASAVANDRFSLALDFGAWMASLWPSMQTAMDVSWDWRETRQGQSDNKLSWNLLIGW